MNLTPKETAARLRMHVNTLAAWRVQGKGPQWFKNGKKVLYPLAEIERWENDLKQSTAG